MEIPSVQNASSQKLRYRFLKAFSQSIGLAILGTIIGILGYLSLENYFQYSYRGGLGYIFVVLMIILVIIIANIIFSIATVIFSRRLRSHQFVTRLMIVAVINIIAVGVIGVYSYISLSDELPTIRAQANNRHTVNNSKKLTDCQKVTDQGSWTSCIRAKVSTDDEYQTCLNQAQNKGYDEKDCSWARAITTQNGKYCNVFADDELGSCAYDIINETFKNISVSKAVEVCGQLDLAQPKSRCYVILIKGKPEAEIKPLAPTFCDAIRTEDLYPEEMSVYNNFCGA